jgi:hypothetical protein
MEIKVYKTDIIVGSESASEAIEKRYGLESGEYRRIIKTGRWLIEKNTETKYPFPVFKKQKRESSFSPEFWQSFRGGKRGKIREFGWKPKSRLRFCLRNVGVKLPYMVTFTYPVNYSRDGRKIEYHKRLLLQWFRDKGITAYFWFREFQSRGAPHFHLLLDMHAAELLRLFNENKGSGNDPLSMEWYRIVGSGDEKHKRAGVRGFEVIRNYNGFISYAIKEYASKNYQKDVPEDYFDAGRFWGFAYGLISFDLFSGKKSWENWELSKWEVQFNRTRRRWYHAKSRKWKKEFREKVRHRDEMNLTRTGRKYIDGRSFFEQFTKHYGIGNMVSVA